MPSLSPLLLSQAAAVSSSSTPTPAANATAVPTAGATAAPTSVATSGPLSTSNTFPAVGGITYSLTFTGTPNPNGATFNTVGYNYNPSPPLVVPTNAPSSQPAPPSGVTPVVVYALTLSSATTVTINNNPTQVWSGVPALPAGKGYYSYFADITAGSPNGYQGPVRPGQWCRYDWREWWWVRNADVGGRRYLHHRVGLLLAHLESSSARCCAAVPHHVNEVGGRSADPRFNRRGDLGFPLTFLALVASCGSTNANLLPRI